MAVASICVTGMFRHAPRARGLTIVALMQLALLSLPAAPGTAAPLDALTQQQLLGIFDSFDKAIVSGKLDAAMALMSGTFRNRIQYHLKTADDRRGALAMARMMVPDDITVVHSFINPPGTRARLVTVVSKTMPKTHNLPDGPSPGSVIRNGMTLGFVKQGGAWMLDEQVFGADPTEVTGCKSETADPRASHDPGWTVSAGGPIVRVDFKPDYTLVVFSVVDEVNCAFPPAKTGLAALGTDPAGLVPYAIVELSGIAHRTDPQKMLAQGVQVHPEE
jgi:hypothetical protein